MTEKIDLNELRLAAKKLEKRRTKLAKTESEMRFKLTDTRKSISEAGWLIMQAQKRLQLLQKAALLRQRKPDQEQSADRLFLSIYCEVAARDDITDDQRVRLEEMVKECHEKLRADCVHELVVCHAIRAYGSSQMNAGEYVVCAWCGLSEIASGIEECQEFGPEEGRMFVFNCDEEGLTDFDE